MEFIDFQTAKKTLPRMIREESFSPARGEREVLWRDPETLEIVAEAYNDDINVEVKFNLESGPVFFTGQQAKQLEDLGESDDNPEQDFIRMSTATEVAFVPNIRSMNRVRNRT